MLATAKGSRGGVRTRGSHCHTGALVRKRRRGTPSATGQARWILVGSLTVALLGGAVVAAETAELGHPRPPGMSPHDLDAREILPSNGSAAQREALHDGAIRPIELLTLANNASQCSVEAGSRPIASHLDGLELKWTLDGNGSDAHDADLMAIAKRCWNEHVHLAETYYNHQIAAQSRRTTSRHASLTPDLAVEPSGELASSSRS